MICPQLPNIAKRFAYDCLGFYEIRNYKENLKSGEGIAFKTHNMDQMLLNQVEISKCSCVAQFCLIWSTLVQLFCIVS